MYFAHNNSLEILDDERRQAATRFTVWLESKDSFPVDGDALWPLLWVKKQGLTYALTKFLEGTDYVRVCEKRSSRGGHNIKKIFLSVTCLKELLMAQNSAEGKRIRR
jgi:hypothetical protein